MPPSQRPALAVLILGLFLLVTFAAYWPGLRGGFVYDDSTSITGNASIMIKDGSLAEWSVAALSFPSGTPPFRSLTMLSFAANYYLGGMDPFGFKLTNLLIHLANGILLFLALRALFGLHQARREDASRQRTFDGGMAAAAIAGLWLLLPINLTAVLYAVQRLESLSTTFVFLGLWWYLRARLRLWRGQRGALSLWLSILVCAGIGVMAKEPAIMLPLYAALVEVTLLGARNNDRKLSRPVLGLFVVTLLLPLLVGLAWMWSRYLGLDALTGRDPFVVHRLLTEARVMLDYMAWTLLPNLDSLTLYHDDIALSTGLLDPPSTLASLGALAILTGAAIWNRLRRPLFALGIFWFLAGHLLTGTVFPLVIAFEHRNYFPSVGLLLAASSLVSLESGLTRARARAALVVAAALLYATTTFMRANEWSDPMRLASSDAMKRPSSPAAQFDLAQALLQEARVTGNQRQIDTALGLLESKRKLAGAGINYEYTIISVLAPSGYKIPPDLWASIISKLENRRPTIDDARSLSRLNHCFISGKCQPSDLPNLRDAYRSAFQHDKLPPQLYSVHAEFAWYLEDDHDRAERDIRMAASLVPGDIEYQKSLIVVLIHQGKLDEAEAMIQLIEKRSHLGMLDGFIKPLRSALAKAHSPASNPDK